ncbi:hypothetical protein OG21DRAFT_936775 [Imleria badia]|nr:hypothetical protein OG21DRAFT_936775 [Imleria badia]
MKKPTLDDYKIYGPGTVLNDRQCLTSPCTIFTGKKFAGPDHSNLSNLRAMRHLTKCSPETCLKHERSITGKMSQLQDPSAPPDFGALNADIVFLLLGMYGWEYIQSLHVEWELVCGRLAFRLSLIPYILGRVCLLIFLIIFVLGTSPYSGAIDYLPGALTLAALASIVMASSSSNFLIRTWVIWKDSRLVHVLLVLLVLGHWTMLAVDVTTVRSININGVGRVFIGHPQVNAATIIYTTLFDLLVFILSVVGLSSQRSESPLKRRLRAQGISYFAVAVIVYIPPMVAALLDITPVYVLGSEIALTISTIVSSRAVRSLHVLDTSDSCSKTLEGDIALTTQIGILRTTVHEGIPSRRHCVDEADRC